MKKLLFIIIPSLLIALLIFLLIQHINNLSLKKGALQVTSQPQSKVYLNDKYIGRTPISKTEPADMIQAGSYTIRLEPLEDNLASYQEKITIPAGILTVVDRKFKKGALSEGYVITLSPLSDPKQSEIEIISFPSKSKVELDSDTLGETPLLYKKPTESDHLLRINKDGYKEKTVRIRTKKGYRLSIIAYLGIKSETGEEISSTTLPSPTPLSSPTPQLSKILILETPTGFLRVRESNTISSAQITTVSPGSTYPLISEESDWYQIQLSDGTKGWISSQYARKNN